MKHSGQRLNLEHSLLALILDGINILSWQFSGKKSKKKPDSIYQILSEPPKPKDELMKFESAEDFEKWYRTKQRSR